MIKVTSSLFLCLLSIPFGFQDDGGQLGRELFVKISVEYVDSISLIWKLSSEICQCPPIRWQRGACQLGKAKEGDKTSVPHAILDQTIIKVLSLVQSLLVAVIDGDWIGTSIWPKKDPERVSRSLSARLSLSGDSPTVRAENLQLV